VIFAPLLIFIYVRISKVEEGELSDNKEYEDYKKEVPFFV
jgi:protein-S-isoprenylcysteine O-methyltransferase Ste14